MKNCKKCGLSIDPVNDAVILDAFIHSGMTPGLVRHKHLFPVIVSGNVICEGSPDLAQYLGAAPDLRPNGTPYKEDMKARVRLAYLTMLRQHISAKPAEEVTGTLLSDTMTANIGAHAHAMEYAVN